MDRAEKEESDIMGWLTNKIDEYKELRKIEKEAYEEELKNVKVENKEYAKERGKQKAQKKSSAKVHADNIEKAKHRGKKAAHRTDTTSESNNGKEYLDRISKAWEF